MKPIIAPIAYTFAALLGPALTIGTPVAAAADEPKVEQTQPLDQSSARIQVRSFKVSGNTLLPPRQIDEALSVYLGERTAAELKQAAATVQAMYSAAGYGAVLAFLPEQALDSGEIAITVLEGKLGQVLVAGNKVFSEENIRAGLPSLTIGVTPRLTAIDAEIQLVNENPAKQVQVLLQPGQRPGEVQARIDVSERPLQRWTASVDNTGNERTGEHRFNLGWQHANVAGLDHVLTTQFQTSVEQPKQVAVASVGYRVPLYGHDLALDGFAAYSDVDGGSAATLAGDLQFAGKGRILGFRVSKYLPRLGELDQRLSAGFEHRAYLNTCELVNFGRANCGAAGESVAVQPVSLDYSLQRGGDRPLGGSVTLVHNLRIGGRHTGAASFNAVREGASANYTLVRLSLTAGFLVLDDWQLSARASAQASFQPLVPGEQFGIGGVNSVRGYQERELTGDRGSFGSIELTSPNLAKAVGQDEGSLNVLGFGDMGYVENMRETPCNASGTGCLLASVGMGLRWATGPLQVRAFLAHALKSAVTTGRHDTRLHFTISLTF